jgi:hypothetical protein
MEGSGLSILIIGNGFDLAHGLKTSYNDFLMWAYNNRKMGRYEEFNLNTYWSSVLRKKGYTIMDYQEENQSTPKFVPDLFAEVDGWIDLENNLAKIIELGQWNAGYVDDTFSSVFNQFLVRTFERYIAEVVNNAEAKEQFPIKEVDKVLSFNYSNTFQRLYNYKVDICYVNGKASLAEGSPHIVFGCDFYDFDQKRLTIYNKIAQRVNINTDGKYRDWLDSLSNTNIYIVGHSLGKTDWEIIRPFVTGDKCKTKVYFHDEASKQSLIHNMIGMVGREFMINNRVEFLPLSEIEIQQSGFIYAPVFNLDD